jgi:hypothetical protein
VFSAYINLKDGFQRGSLSLIEIGAAASTLFEDKIKNGGGVVAARIISKFSTIGREERIFPTRRKSTHNT